MMHVMDKSYSTYLICGHSLKCTQTEKEKLNILSLKILKEGFGKA